MVQYRSNLLNGLRRMAPVAAAIGGLLLLSACGSASNSLSSLRETLTGSRTSEQPPAAQPRGQAQPQGQPQAQAQGLPPRPGEGISLSCPTAEVRAEGAHYTIRAKGEIRDDKAIRYQGTLDKVSRECDFQPEYFAVKFGFAGRVLVGPSGGAGTVNLPVKVDFTTRGDRVVWSKIYKVPVTFAPGQVSVPFVHVSSDLVYQPKVGERLEDFRLYVAFDGAEGR